LICANHANSLFDPVLVGVAARRPVKFMAKAPLFDTPVLGPAMKALGMVPAFRGSDDARQVRPSSS
jgi:1-acyl-sn-glycerol-3-phosphate acyltransferase